VRRVFALLVTALGTGAFAVEYVRLPIENLKVGDVAERSIRATGTFPFVDWNATLDRQRVAEARVQPVFDFDSTLATRIRSRVEEAFDVARHRLQEVEADGDEASERLTGINRDFLQILDISLDPTTLERLINTRW
jgi:membrane-associated HD superfamily phosphohydrolase